VLRRSLLPDPVTSLNGDIAKPAGWWLRSARQPGTTSTTSQSTISPWA